LRGIGRSGKSKICSVRFVGSRAIRTEPRRAGSRPDCRRFARNQQAELAGIRLYDGPAMGGQVLPRPRCLRIGGMAGSVRTGWLLVPHQAVLRKQDAVTLLTDVGFGVADVNTTQTNDGLGKRERIGVPDPNSRSALKLRQDRPYWCRVSIRLEFSVLGVIQLAQKSTVSVSPREIVTRVSAVYTR
jgi:hypothetical protein